MSDIVERLRSGAAHQTLVTTGLVNQAAAEITALRAEVNQAAAEITALRAALEAEVEKLRAALCPLAGVFLYPDDLGFEASSDIKEDLDWDDDANDMNTENVFVLRRDIRRARAALEEK